jgi:glyoxylase-like metal-dependent hydrolase (beta-lactamase superfamily II)
MGIDFDCWILLNTGSSYQIGKMMLDKVKAITDKPIFAVFNTHIHGDHWLGNQAIVEQYPSVNIYAHIDMIIVVHFKGFTVYFNNL